MKEIFYEESSLHSSISKDNSKFIIFNIASIVSFVFSLIWFIFAINYFEFDSKGWLLSIIILVIPFVLFFACGILFATFRNKFCVDYDYTFVSGSIRFAKVIHNTKRKEIISFDVSNIERIGICGSENFDKFNSIVDIKKMVLTSNKTASKDKDFYYMIVNLNNIKYLFIIEATKIFISNIKLFSNPYIFEKEMLK